MLQGISPVADRQEQIEIRHCNQELLHFQCSHLLHHCIGHQESQVLPPKPLLKHLGKAVLHFAGNELVQRGMMHHDDAGFVEKVSHIQRRN